MHLSLLKLCNRHSYTLWEGMAIRIGDFSLTSLCTVFALRLRKKTEELWKQTNAQIY